MIRPAHPADAATVHDVVFVAYRHYTDRIGKPPGPMLDDYSKRIADGQVWVAEAAGRIFGILVLVATGSELLLDNVAVLPESQGRGYGHALIKFAEAEALRRGCRAVRLYTHVLMTENIARYRRAGFVETHRVNENGYDRVYMEKQLRNRETSMTTLELIGVPQSNFVRTARMACIEKGVPYTLDPARPHTPDVDSIHPFGKIPVMRHGDLRLCETKAICTYVDLAFDGPPLIPRDPVGAARTEQWISLVNTGFDLVFIRQYLVAYFFSGLPDGAADRAKIAAALPTMREMFAVLDRELGARAYLAGESFTLADAFLLPLMHYMRLMEESGEMMRASPHVSAWFERLATRPSAKETEPPPIPRRRT
jgi:glutathione S-transferase